MPSAPVTKTMPSMLLVAPMLNERQDAFVERADRALRQAFPDRNSRMSAIVNAWDKSGKDADLNRKAKESLAAIAECDPSELDDVFVTRANRPIFPEHIDDSGKRYSRAELAQIVDRCNARIMETGDLSPMSVGHTPTREQLTKGMPMPEVIGFSGPFRLGLIGEDKPKWCVFADEHVFKEDFSRVQMKMPRRSPEVWPDNVLDPIAVLGAETPRLDTGVTRFSRSRRLDPARYAVNVTRYSMGAAAMPGGMNTFVQSEKYSAGDNEMAGMDQESMQTMVEAVLAGISATPQWAWLTDQMQTSQNPVPEDADAGPTPSADAEVETDADQPGAETATTAADEVAKENGSTSPANPAPGPEKNAADESAKPAEAGSDSPAPASEATPSPKEDAAVSPEAKEPPGIPAPEARPEEAAASPGASPEELASMNDDEKAEYSKLDPASQQGYMMARRRYCKADGATQYSRGGDAAKYSRMEHELTSLRGENAALRSERTRTQRYSRLSDLSQQFDFEIEDEITDCSTMSDDQFERHCEKTVTKYSRRDPNGGMPRLVLPALEQQRSKDDDEKKERYSRRAVEIATKSGGKMSWDDALTQAKAELDKTTTAAV